MMSRNRRHKLLAALVAFLGTTLGFYCVVGAEEAGEKMPFKGRVEATVGSYETYEGRLQLRRSLDDWSTGFSLAGKSRAGWQENDDRSFSQIGAWLSWQLSENVSLKPEASFSWEEAGMPGYKDFVTPSARKRQEISTAALLFKLDQVTLQSSFTDKTLWDDDDEQNLHSRLRLQNASAAVSGSHRPAPGMKFAFGATGNWLAINPSGERRREESRGSAYLSTEWEPLEAPFLFFLEGRGDYDSEFGSGFNPQGRLRFGNNLFYLELGFERQQNAPSPEQRWQRSSSRLPHPALTMEKVNKWNFTVLSNAYDSPTIRLDFFFRQTENAIIFSRQPRQPGRYENVNLAIAWGTEFFFSWKPTDELRLALSWRYQEACSGDRWLPGQPRHTAGLTLDYQALDELTLSVEGKYNSEVFINRENSHSLPEYFCLDLRLQYRHEELTLTAAVTNLLDRRYTWDYGVAAPPFEAQLEVKYEW